MPSIEQLRQQIEQTDSEIIEKLAARQELSKQIGQLKRVEKKAIIDPLREKNQFNGYAALCEKHKLPYTVVQQVFEIIIAHSRKIQQ